MYVIILTDYASKPFYKQRFSYRKRRSRSWFGDLFPLCNFITYKNIYVPIFKLHNNIMRSVFPVGEESLCSSEALSHMSVYLRGLVSGLMALPLLSSLSQQAWEVPGCGQTAKIST